MAGIVVGVMVFIALAVTGVVLAIILTWCFKCRHKRYFVKMKSEGLDNPNYGEVDHGTLSQTSARDYEVPIPMNSEAQQQPGQPTHYINIPNQNLTTKGSNSGDYSYVLVSHPHITHPQRSYDSHFLQSSEESWDLPRVVAAESGDPTSGKLTTNYSLLDNYFAD